jgi:hypothetical protein
MQNSIESLRSRADLLAKVLKASAHKLTREDILEQKVSFVYGSIDSKNNSLTREQVRDLIMSHEGESKRVA